ncbi:hypothetical protein Syun_014750 [Stephania yunnanensis]|uniref:Reverse transcriptase Ty1/copia-type domain-containing protein n=1 Tax=Stephania yunnanensis TaxID=152371 RepID=A0AAP0JM33_9MAGN
MVYILIYVDDIHITSNDTSLVCQFIDQLNKVFALKDLGDLNLLGIEVSRDDTGFHLNQASYIKTLLHKAGMDNLKHVSTPAMTTKQLVKVDAPAFSYVTLYRSLLRGLQYLTHTRPDISFIVNKLSQFQQFPTVSYWLALKRVLRYVNGTMYDALHIKSSAELSITGFADADWSCSPDDRRSIGGYSIYFGGALVS